MLRILLPVLALVLAAGAYWLFRSPEQRGNAPAPVASPAAKGPAEGAAERPAGAAGDTDRTLPRPVRMRSNTPTPPGSVAPVAASQSLATSYQDEARDPRVADAHTAEVREIVEELAESGIGTAHIESLDCRSRHCKLQLSSDDGEGLVKLVDALQDERGFLGKAESIMLSRDQDDMIFYLRFAPPK